MLVFVASPEHDRKATCRIPTSATSAKPMPRKAEHINSPKARQGEALWHWGHLCLLGVLKFSCALEFLSAASAAALTTKGRAASSTVGLLQFLRKDMSRSSPPAGPWGTWGTDYSRHSRHSLTKRANVRNDRCCGRRRS